MSLLHLPEQPDVSWARLLEGAGEGGSYAYQIDASGSSVRNRMMYRMLLPNGNAPSVKTKLRVKSTMTVGNPAFEGLAVRHRGYKLSGGVPSTSDEQVWDSDPASKGKRAWYAEQSGTYTDAVFIEPVPRGLAIDYITFELVVRAIDGQVTIDDVACRPHYAVPYDLSVLGFQLWTSGFSIETVSPGISGDDAVQRWLRYIKTVSTPIRTGQLVNNIFKGAITGRAFEANGADPNAAGYDARRLGSDVGFMLKMRRIGTSTYDYFTLVRAPVSVDNKTHFADGSVQFKAKYDYDQTEVLCYVEPTQADPAYTVTGVDRMGIQDLELEQIVTDYITPTQ